MGHKRHRIKGDFTNVNPGRGGPGITEDGYPPHLVAVSVEHPEINPKGVTIESFTEEVSEEKIFGVNVGEVLEDFINNEETNNSNEKDTTMNTKETTNNEQNNMNTNKETETMNNTNNPNNNENNKENVNMNTNPNVNQDGTIDDGSNNVNPQKPSLAKEAANAFVVGAAYGAGTVVAVIGISLLVSGIRKLACGDATTADAAAATSDTTETVETVAEAFLR